MSKNASFIFKNIFALKEKRNAENINECSLYYKEETRTLFSDVNVIMSGGKRGETTYADAKFRGDFCAGHLVCI